MKAEKVTVLVLPVDGEPYFRTVNNTLESKQAMVGGRIQYIALEAEDHVYDLWCNEDGLVDDLPRNPHVPSLWGNLYVAKANSAGEDVTLDPEDQSRLIRKFIDKELL